VNIMGSIRRMAAPILWKISRKTGGRYATVPKPGPHAIEKCLTLAYVIRDALKIAENAREVRMLLNRGIVKVDGHVRKDVGFPVGLMDIVSIGDSVWRVLPGKRGFELKPVSAAESGTKLLKVVNKTHVRGRMQLNLHDGRNMLVDKDIYKTSDVLVYDLAQRVVKSVVQFKRGTLVLIAEGKNRGKIGRVEDIAIIRGPQPNRVIIKSEGETIETLKDFAFAIGQDKPVIAL